MEVLLWQLWHTACSRQGTAHSSHWNYLLLMATRVGVELFGVCNDHVDLGSHEWSLPSLCLLCPHKTNHTGSA
jgi:hypothetical protein